MGIPVICKRCGAHFPFRGMGGSGTFSFKNCLTDCPVCGVATPIEDGTYEIAQSVFKAFRALDVADLVQFQEALQDADGKPAADLASVADGIDPTFGQIVKVVQALGGLPLLVALIGFYIQYLAYKSDSQHQEEVITELRASTANLERMIENHDEIIDGLREIIGAQEKPELRPYSQQTPQSSHMPPSESSGSDRAARRRAWKAERKAFKDKSIAFRR